MKKNKKGFTLVELLAVIVVLGIIVAIAAPNLLNARKAANIEEAKQMEKMIEDLGPTIYTGDKSVGSLWDEYQNNINMGNSQNFGNGFFDMYLKKYPFDNPTGGNSCEAYLKVTKTNDGPIFEGHICCPGLYRTSPTSSYPNTSLKCRTALGIYKY